jgi:hypothetical protein
MSALIFFAGLFVGIVIGAFALAILLLITAERLS